MTVKPSVPVEVVEWLKTGSQTKTWIYADFEGFFREQGWCCQTGLNCRPLHYQWRGRDLKMPYPGNHLIEF
jgi:hypothetical protein